MIWFLEDTCSYGTAQSNCCTSLGRDANTLSMSPCLSFRVLMEN